MQSDLRDVWPVTVRILGAKDDAETVEAFHIQVLFVFVYRAAGNTVSPCYDEPSS